MVKMVNTNKEGMKMYIVLFKDGAMMPVTRKPQKEAFQKEARFFKVNDDLTMLELSGWYAIGCPSIMGGLKRNITEIAK